MKYRRLTNSVEEYGIHTRKLKEPMFGMTEYKVLQAGKILGYVFQLTKSNWYYRLPDRDDAVGPYKYMVDAALKLKRTHVDGKYVL